MVSSTLPHWVLGPLRSLHGLEAASDSVAVTSAMLGGCEFEWFGLSRGYGFDAKFIAKSSRSHPAVKKNCAT